MNRVEPSEVDVPAVHDVKLPGSNAIRSSSVRSLAFPRKYAKLGMEPQIEHGMQLHRGLIALEACPRKEHDKHTSMMVESSA